MSQQTEVTGTGVFADEEEAGSASRTGVFAHEGSASGSRKRSFGAMLTGVVTHDDKGRSIAAKKEAALRRLQESEACRRRRLASAGG